MLYHQSRSINPIVQKLADGPERMAANADKWLKKFVCISF